MPIVSFANVRAGALTAALVASCATATLAQAKKGDRDFGQYLSSECVTCHQSSGRFDGIPPIVGWPEDTFIAIMKEYRARARANPVMQTIAGKFNDDEVAALAAYFGSLSPQPAK